jgi:hypothetical protein
MEKDMSYSSSLNEKEWMIIESILLEHLPKIQRQTRPLKQRYLHLTSGRELNPQPVSRSREDAPSPNADSVPEAAFQY